MMMDRDQLNRDCLDRSSGDFHSTLKYLMNEASLDLPSSKTMSN